MKEVMKFPWSKWIIASFAAGWGGAIGVTSYLNAYTFSRAEGEDLGKHVFILERDIKADITALRMSFENSLIRKSEDEEDMSADSDDLLAQPKNAKKPSEPKLTEKKKDTATF